MKNTDLLAFIASNKANSSKNFISVLLAFVLFICEGFFFYLLLLDNIGLFLFLSIHFLCLTVAVFFIYFAKKHHHDLRSSLLLGIAIFGLGPFGSIGFLIHSILYPLLAKYSTTPQKWLQDLFPEHEETDFFHIFQRIKSGWNEYHPHQQTLIFKDVFIYGTLSQKQAVLDAIVKNPDPLFTPILKQALNDPNNVIRIQASAIFAKIDLDFTSGLQKLYALQGEVPDPLFSLKLANYYENYAFSGILDDKRREETLIKALNYYKDSLKNETIERKISIAICRIYFYLKDYENVIIWVEKYERQFQTLPGLLNSWYCESLYNLKQYEKLYNVNPVF